MEDTNKQLKKENISYKEFLQGVPFNLHYEYNFMKGLDREQMQEEVQKILIGFITVIVGAVAVLIPTCLQ
jgi:hypothetical protein